MAKSKVLLIHMPYQVRGGEDVHVETLAAAYARIGVEVRFFPRDRKPARPGLAASLASLLPSANLPELDAELKEFAPDFLHAHNIYPTLGPRFLRWAARQKIPLAMTIHNHRFFCTNGLALRNGKNCKACFHSKLPWRGILNNCNRDFARSLYYTLAIGQIRTHGLLDHAVDKFIAPSPYVRTELTRFGAGPCKVEYLLHPTAPPPAAALESALEFDAIYAGRLSAEKGIRTLLEAAVLLPKVKFAIVGDGPEAASVAAAANTRENLKYFPGKSHSEALALLGKSRIGVAPSICNDTVSLFALEVFYQGKHCVFSDMESMQWFAGGEFPGHLSRAGDAPDLARAIESALKVPPINSTLATTLREKLGMERFCAELHQMVNSL